MLDDLLAPFRRLGAAGAVSMPGARAVEPYRAFSVARGAARPQRLELRPRDGLAVARLYSSLIEIAYDQNDYTGILLIFAGDRMVKIRGRHLRPVIEALVTGTCDMLIELEGETSLDMPTIEQMEMLAAKRPGSPD